MKKITYAELRNLFREPESTNPRKHLTGFIVFTEDSFEQSYPLDSRTYEVSSNHFIQSSHELASNPESTSYVTHSCQLLITTAVLPSPVILRDIPAFRHGCLHAHQYQRT